MKHVLLAAFVSAAALASCQQPFKKTPSGLPYKIIKGNGKTPLAKAGQVVKFQLKLNMKSGSKDTTLVNTYEDMPAFNIIDTGSRAAYSFMELMPKCTVGDSAVFTMSVDTLKKKNMLPPDNNVFKKGGIIKGSFKILKIYPSAQDPKLNEDYMNESIAARNRAVGKESKEMQEYLAKNNIKAVKTKGGAFVEIMNEGAGQKADSGKTAAVKYTGRLLKEGTVFDSNMDTAFHHTDPIMVTVGSHGVIPGWEEGLPYFGAGGKGKIYIPASLGYGKQGSGPIPPSSPLVFDVEILEVKTATPPAAPAMGPATAAPGNK
jgi:FKBP-type peptidyl-prolyl cis-trans isomerase FkpA